MPGTLNLKPYTLNLLFWKRGEDSSEARKGRRACPKRHAFRGLAERFEDLAGFSSEAFRVSGLGSRVYGLGC